MSSFGYDIPPDDIFDFSKPFERVYLAGGQTEGYVQCNDTLLTPDLEERPYQGQDYVEEYRRKEREELQRGYEVEQERERARASSSGMDEIEITSGGSFQDVHELETTDIYKNYYKDSLKSKRATNLMISDYRRNIVTMIQNNEVTIITGPTGCGKTTQVPQYILDYHAENNLHCNIVVTQPRRIAAITVARRVCDERDWPKGTLCGYQVGHKAETSEDTRLTYVTVGVLIKQIVSAKDLNRYTHIILDEVHERNQETDFALLVVKRLLATNSRNVKVVLMSATVDAAKFASYFQRVFGGNLVPAPVINIKKQRLYPIQIHYIEELKTLGELPSFEFDEPCISEAALKICLKLIKNFDRIDPEEKNKKSVLVFLPGLAEIEDLHGRLTDPKFIGSSETPHYRVEVIPLHSTITYEEQMRAFKPSSTGSRKVILATNIAESSITVEDVKFVIDFCLTKVLRTDPVSNFTSLQLAWTSKSNCEQRAGRVGRVMEGRVYRMVTKDFYNRFLADECEPDMLRCPLEKVVLETKMLDMGEPKALLALALDPPNLSDIERTILVLKQAGGLLLTSGGIPTPYDGDITFLGVLMAELPMDIRLTRLVALGYLFSLLPECIIMAASMSLKSVFKTPFKEKMNAYNFKLNWANSSCSDCIAFLNVYKLWKELSAMGHFNRSVGPKEKQWAAQHFVEIKALKDVEVLVEDITRRLRQNQIEEFRGRNKVQYNDFEKALVLKMILAGAFYPNYFGRGITGGQVMEPEAVKTLGGRDPYTTVYLTGYPREQPPHLYSQLIREQLRDCKDDMRITYDGSQKVYIEFRRSEHKRDKDMKYDDKIPGKISMAVYRAVKLRQIQKYLEIRVLPAHNSRKIAEKLGIDCDRDTFSKFRKYDTGETPMETDSESIMSDSSSALRPFPSNLPSVDVSTLHIDIVYFQDPGHFWATHVDHRSQEYSKQIMDKLNMQGYRFPPFLKSPQPGDMCIAPYSDNNEPPFALYRARIDEVMREGNVVKAKVFFIDYGNCSTLNVNRLCEYGEMYDELSKYPMQAFECVLANIKPSLVKNKDGLWSRESKIFFKKEVDSQDLFGQIYSVVSGVVAIDLQKIKPVPRGARASGSTVEYISINQRLVENGFAEFTEESYLSKANHEIRLKATDLDAKEAYNSMQESDSWSENRYDPPDSRDCKVTLQLRGPHSPLEMKIYSYTRGAFDKEIKISQDSVNSVLLDTDPQDAHERLVVASHVSQNQSGTALILHSTTIMPNIHGMAALIPFLFAPAVELRVDDARTRYTGILCGLGVDSDGKPMFPEHDMEIAFDVEFSVQDLEKINFIRHLMSFLLFTEKDSKFPDLSEKDVMQGQTKIKNLIMELVIQQRKSQEISYSRKYVWGLAKGKCSYPDKQIRQASKRFIFRPHNSVEIRPENEEAARMKRHNEELYRRARAGVEKWEPIECELCCVTLMTIPALRIHLDSRIHKENEEEIFES